MLVAQSYTHRTMSKSHYAKRHSSRSRKQELDEKQPVVRDGRPKFMFQMTSPTSSQPVVIPSRTLTQKNRTQQETPQHDDQAVPPSMAALLAVASVHTPKSASTNRRLSEKLIHKETLSPDDFRFTLSSSSPKSWSILQSPPGEEEEESKEYEADSFSITSGSTRAPLSSYRSLSTDSVPSLEIEFDVESSTSVDPVTPSCRGRLEQRKVSLPRSSLCETEHPLSPPLEKPAELQAPSEGNIFELELAPTTATPKSLTSNLTASLRMLKSAARTTLASISPRDYTPDPLSSFSAPVSTLPIATTGMALPNIDALPFHITTALPELPPGQMSIQLMPYIPSPIPSSESATAPPVFLPVALPSDGAVARKNSPRPREPRENSDFMRIVVMEMNMRRAGKLNSEGRARIWLGARKDGKTGGAEGREQYRGRDIPKRWSAVTI